MKGVTFLDHTADVGCRVRAPTLDALFHRAARAMLALLDGLEDEAEEDPDLDPDPDPATPASDPDPDPDLGVHPGIDFDSGIELHSRGEDGPGGLAGLLRDWLRELLFLHEVRGRDYAGARFDRLDEGGLVAAVATTPSAPAVREIKGVTHHGLAVREGPGGWEATVIFDV